MSICTVSFGRTLCFYGKLTKKVYFYRKKLRTNLIVVLSLVPDVSPPGIEVCRVRLNILGVVGDPENILQCRVKINWPKEPVLP